jgi:hypothetical protein
MIYKLFILMLLCHVIDDFVLQPVCLSKLKQKDWWKNNVSEQDYYKYMYDYQMALWMHCMSWSAMIHLPLMIFLDCSGMILFISFAINAVIHYVIDDLKANEKKINLKTDQLIHIVQIFLTLIINISLI